MRADACLFLMHHYNAPGLVNIGWGKDISIAELAHLIQHITGFQGTIRFDTSKPDGTPRKLMDVSKLNRLGWHAHIHLEQGLKMVYEQVKNEPWEA